MADDFINCNRCEKITWMGSTKICEECSEYFCKECDVCKDEKDCDTPKKYKDIIIAELKEDINKLKKQIKKLQKKQG